MLLYERSHINMFVLKDAKDNPYNFSADTVDLIWSIES